MEGRSDYTCTSLSQCWTDPSLPAVSLCTPYLQVKDESGPISGIDEESAGLFAENILPQSNFSGYEEVPPVLIEDPACLGHTHFDATYDSPKDGIMLDCAISSSVTEVSRTVRPADMHENPKRIFPCDECDKHYTQRQGVTRHQREAHGRKNLCPNCNDFTWIRRYQLTKHLREQHPGIDLKETLNKVTRCRRQATKNRKHMRQLQAPPTIERVRKSHNEPLPRSPMHTLPTVAKDSRFSIHTMLPMVYDPYPEHHAERPFTSCKREDARGLDLFGATDAPSASSFAEERFQLVNDVGTSVQHGQNWSLLARTGPSWQPSLWDNYLLSLGTDLMPTRVPASTGLDVIGDSDIETYHIRQRLAAGIPRICSTVGL